MYSIKLFLLKGKKYLFDKDYRFVINSGLGFHNAMADDIFLSKLFRIKCGYDLNLDAPKTYNEKLQWLKIFNRRPEYTMMVDKYLVRSYVKERIGEEHLIPLLGVWKRPEDIDFDTLPTSFVLKCNHNSGVGMCICKDKSKLDFRKVRAELQKGLNQDYYLTTREWPYKDVPRRIIAEKFMTDKHSSDLKDYKFFCFNGKPMFLFVASDRPYDTRFDFYDTEFNHLPFKQGHPWATKKIDRPKTFDEMLRLASILSEGIPHVRVDLYEINGQIYFGEMTFFQYSGLVPFEPREWDLKLGELLILPEKYTNIANLTKK